MSHGTRPLSGRAATPRTVPASRDAKQPHSDSNTPCVRPGPSLSLRAVLQGTRDVLKVAASLVKPMALLALMTRVDTPRMPAVSRSPLTLSGLTGDVCSDGIKNFMVGAHPLDNKDESYSCGVFIDLLGGIAAWQGDQRGMPDVGVAIPNPGNMRVIPAEPDQPMEFGCELTGDPDTQRTLRMPGGTLNFYEDQNGESPEWKQALAAPAEISIVYTNVLSGLSSHIEKAPGMLTFGFPWIPGSNLHLGTDESTPAVQPWGAFDTAQEAAPTLFAMTGRLWSVAGSGLFNRQRMFDHYLEQGYLVSEVQLGDGREGNAALFIPPLPAVVDRLRMHAGSQGENINLLEPPPESLQLFKDRYPQHFLKSDPQPQKAQDDSKASTAPHSSIGSPIGLLMGELLIGVGLLGASAGMVHVSMHRKGTRQQPGTNPHGDSGGEAPAPLGPRAGKHRVRSEGSGRLLGQDTASGAEPPAELPPTCEAARETAQARLKGLTFRNQKVQAAGLGLHIQQAMDDNKPAIAAAILGAACSCTPSGKLADIMGAMGVDHQALRDIRVSLEAARSRTQDSDVLAELKAGLDTVDHITLQWAAPDDANTEEDVETAGSSEPEDSGSSGASNDGDRLVEPPQDSKTQAQRDAGETFYHLKASIGRGDIMGEFRKGIGKKPDQILIPGGGWRWHFHVLPKSLHFTGGSTKNSHSFIVRDGQFRPGVFDSVSAEIDHLRDNKAISLAHYQAMRNALDVVVQTGD